MIEDVLALSYQVILLGSSLLQRHPVNLKGVVCIGSVGTANIDTKVDRASCINAGEAGEALYFRCVHGRVGWPYSGRRVGNTQPESPAQAFSMPMQSRVMVAPALSTLHFLRLEAVKFERSPANPR